MSEKNFFCNKNGEIHFGSNSPGGFRLVSKEEAEDLMQTNHSDKIFFRCKICGDCHLGSEEIQNGCPTCKVPGEYERIIENEFRLYTKLR